MAHHVLPQDVTNTINQGSGPGLKRPREVSLQTLLVEGLDVACREHGVPSKPLDKRALKRQNDRERYASSTQEHNTSRAAKPTENYHQRKAGRLAIETPGTKSFNETDDHAGKERLHSTDSSIRRNGSMPDHYVQLPDDIMIGASRENESIDMFLNRVFPNLHDNCTSATYMRQRAILSMRSKHVDAINALMIDKFPGKEKVYYSFDSVDIKDYYLEDFVNSITPNGLPPHVLKVKENCPIVLLCNLDPHSALRIGTRLLVRGLQNHVIKAEILDGQHAGTEVYIPRIPMSPTEDFSLPCKFKRKQFPIRLGFAIMTNNKA